VKIVYLDVPYSLRCSCREQFVQAIPVPKRVLSDVVTTDELLGVKLIKSDTRAEDPETRHLWKKC
jgi:hypothetical protein